MDIIEHPGVVVATDREMVEVKILQVSACATCHAKGACNMADMEEKIIRVEDYTGRPLLPGEKVTLKMQQSAGSRAVVLGYLVPFLVMMAVMIAGSFFIREEGILALVSIGSLVPYFVLLYLNRDRIKKKFVIQIKP